MIYSLWIGLSSSICRWFLFVDSLEDIINNLKRDKDLLGKILDHEMENRYASIPKSFIKSTSAYIFFCFWRSDGLISFLYTTCDANCAIIMLFIFAVLLLWNVCVIFPNDADFLLAFKTKFMRNLTTGAWQLSFIANWIYNESLDHQWFVL